MLQSTAEAPPVLSLALANELAALEPARRAVLDFVAGQGLSARALYRLELVLEETLMNRILHAYPEGGRHSIALTLRLAPDAVTISFEDDGLPFDPLQAAPPVLPRTLAEARPGGLGLHLTRKAAAHSHYEREGGRNRLTLQIARA